MLTHSVVLTHGMVWCCVVDLCFGVNPCYKLVLCHLCVGRVTQPKRRNGAKEEVSPAGLLVFYVLSEAKKKGQNIYLYPSSFVLIYCILYFVLLFVFCINILQCNDGARGPSSEEISRFI